MKIRIFFFPGDEAEAAGVFPRIVFSKKGGFYSAIFFNNECDNCKEFCTYNGDGSESSYIPKEGLPGSMIDCLERARFMFRIWIAHEIQNVDNTMKYEIDEEKLPDYLKGV